ncbi:MAG: ATP synthase subunit I [Pseudomonadota bacterium]
MTESLAVLATSFIWGLILGAFFFGGLWLTVGRLAGMRRPFLLLAASFVLRGGGVLVGFYMVSDGWQQLLICLGGFIVMRAMISARIKKTAGSLIAPGGD